MPALKYVVIAEMITIVSSTKSPRDKSKAKKAMKENSILKVFITVKLIKNVNGIAKEETTACRRPKNMSKVKKTKETVMIKSL